MTEGDSILCSRLRLKEFCPLTPHNTLSCMSVFSRGTLSSFFPVPALSLHGDSWPAASLFLQLCQPSISANGERGRKIGFNIYDV